MQKCNFFNVSVVKFNENNQAIARSVFAVVRVKDFTLVKDFQDVKSFSNILDISDIT